jgi:hypothetical protein
MHDATLCTNSIGVTDDLAMMFICDANPIISGMYILQGTVVMSAVYVAGAVRVDTL